MPVSAFTKGTFGTKMSTVVVDLTSASVTKDEESPLAGEAGGGPGGGDAPHGARVSGRFSASHVPAREGLLLLQTRGPAG